MLYSSIMNIIVISYSLRAQRNTLLKWYSNFRCTLYSNTHLPPACTPPNHLTIPTFENSYLAATCKMMHFCVKASDYPPPFFYSFWPPGRTFQHGGWKRGKVLYLGSPPFIFIQPTFSAFYLPDNWAEGIFFFLASFPRLGRFRTSAPSSFPPGNGSDSINVCNPSPLLPSFHASVNPSLSRWEKVEGFFQVSERENS